MAALTALTTSSRDNGSTFLCSPILTRRQRGITTRFELVLTMAVLGLKRITCYSTLEAGAGYPSLSRVDDEHLGIVYEGSQAHMVFERISLDELLRR